MKHGTHSRPYSQSRGIRMPILENWDSGLKSLLRLPTHPCTHIQFQSEWCMWMYTYMSAWSPAFWRWQGINAHYLVAYTMYVDIVVSDFSLSSTYMYMYLCVLASSSQNISIGCTCIHKSNFVVCKEPLKCAWQVHLYTCTCTLASVHMWMLMYGRQLMDSVHHTAGIKCAEQTTYVNDIDSSVICTWAALGLDLFTISKPEQLCYHIHPHKLTYVQVKQSPTTNSD